MPPSLQGKTSIYCTRVHHRPAITQQQFPSLQGKTSIYCTSEHQPAITQQQFQQRTTNRNANMTRSTSVCTAKSHTRNFLDTWTRNIKMKNTWLNIEMLATRTQRKRYLKKFETLGIISIIEKFCLPGKDSCLWNTDQQRPVLIQMTSVHAHTALPILEQKTCGATSAKWNQKRDNQQCASLQPANSFSLTNQEAANTYTPFFLAWDQTL